MATLSLQNEWITEKEAAERLRCSKRTIRNYRVSGLLKRWTVRPTGRGFLYSAKELDKFLIKAA